MSIGNKRPYSFEGLTKPVSKEDKGVTLTMNLKKGPTALHTWFMGKDNTMLSAYYVYIHHKDWDRGTLMKTEPTALAAGSEDAIDNAVIPEASAYGSQNVPFSSAQPEAPL